MAVTTASPQVKFFSFQKDSIPTFRGFAVSLDLVGVGLMHLTDNGQYEGALRLNLHDEWFPIVELGLGKANHDPYRLYVGLRYAFTSYKVDISRPDFPDPVWKWNTGYGIKDLACKFHWIEAVVGVDAKIFGPLHLGWSFRYKRRIAHSEGDLEKTWYVPGFGLYGDTRLGGTFNVIIDI